MPIKLRDLLDRRFIAYSFSEIHGGIKRYILMNAGFAVIGLLVAVMCGITFWGVKIESYLSFLLFPIFFAGFFGWIAYYAYLIGRTGNYTVMEGVCIESEKTANPIKKITNSAFQRRTRFTLETDEGEYYKVLCRTGSDLPKQGMRVQVVYSNNTTLIPGELCQIIQTYYAIQIIRPAKNKENKENKK